MIIAPGAVILSRKGDNMKPDIYIVDQHHQVLEYWAELRRTLPEAPAVWSLDYHTDTMPCFRGKLPPPVQDDFQSRQKVTAAISTLRHDEHFDWALRAGIVSRIHLGICGAETDIIAHPEICVCRPAGFPEPEIILNSPEISRPYLEKFLSDDSLRQLFPRLPSPGENYILDIDCDCILCRKALFPENSGIIDELLKNARLITISLENDWVKLLKLPGETITGTEISRIIKERTRHLDCNRIFP